jgi:hypothetical protein
LSNLLIYAIPGFLLSLWLERLWAGRQAGGQVRGYETRDTLASLGIGVGNVIISAFSTLGAAPAVAARVSAPRAQSRSFTRDLGAHVPRAPLRSTGHQHSKHHSGTHDSHYRITTGWLNPLLDLTGFFRHAGWLLAKLGLQRSN